MTRQEELTKQLASYAEAYYNSDAPFISDAEYDALYDELLSLERESGVVLPDSPTTRVGAKADATTPSAAAFLPHTHIRRLYSLDKVRSFQALSDWAERCKSGCVGIGTPAFALEYKFDGLTINLTYENGRFVNGATRGNGDVGDTIYDQLLTVRSIPRTIPFLGRMEVQGECIMRLSVLDELNKVSTEPLKNARNAAAGALRNTDARVTAARRLDCFLYNVGYIEGKTLSSQTEMLDFLRENGFPVSPFLRICPDAESLEREIDAAEETRASLDFLIDGMVVKITDFSLRDALGETEKFPRWAMAYKFAAEETTSVVREVTWEVGRTGKLTPLAHLDPVELAGATVKRATLNNFDDVCRKRVGIGSRVFIRRSNDVIPEILGAVPNDTPERPVEKPTRCPQCGAHVEERGAHLFCTNSLSCTAQITLRIAHFASRDAMDIESLSDKTAAQLIEALNVTSVPHLYALSHEQLVSLDRFGEKKAQNLLAALEKSKTRPLSAFLFALGIPNVGLKTARDVARRYGTLEAVRQATRESLLEIPDVGEIIADSIVTFLSDLSIVSQIDELLSLGVSPAPEAAAAENAALAGKAVVVTGTLPTLGRRDAESLIEKYGGKAAGSVSKKTDYVLYGEEAGGKLTKARELNVPLLTEDEFLRMIGERP